MTCIATFAYVLCQIATFFDTFRFLLGFHYGMPWLYCGILRHFLHITMACLRHMCLLALYTDMDFSFLRGLLANACKAVLLLANTRHCSDRLGQCPWEPLDWLAVGSGLFCIANQNCNDTSTACHYFHWNLQQQHFY